MGYISDIQGYKKSAEAELIGILYKQPTLLYNYKKIKLEDLDTNIWKVYFAIIKQLVIVEHKDNIDEIVVGLFLEKHLKLKERYDDYGGFKTVKELETYVETGNMLGTIREIHKWKIVLKLIKAGFPIKDRMSEIKDMRIEELYDIYKAYLNSIFIEIDDEVKSEDLTDNLDDDLDKWNEGLAQGFDLWNSQLLNSRITGTHNGNMYLLGALSGAGKTYLTIILKIMANIKANKRIVVILNEESSDRIKKDILTYIINNEYKFDFNKRRFQEGNFDELEWKYLNKAKEYLKNDILNKLVTIIPLGSYSVDTTIRLIRKFASLGVDDFILDTFKLDVSTSESQSWLALMKDSVKLYDVIKPVNENVMLWTTYQLKKTVVNDNYLTVDSLGMSKSIIDVYSVGLLTRKVRVDEFSGNLAVWRYSGQNNQTQIPVELDNQKTYLIFFLIKNRFGEAEKYQTVAEVDFGRMLYKEVGICSIMPDKKY